MPFEPGTVDFERSRRLEAEARVAELENFERMVRAAWEAHKDCGPECSLNDELEIILNP